jgi:hypothetical protein
VSIIQTGNRTHDATCATAEMVRQVADSQPGATQASLNANSVTYFRAVIASCVTNGLDAGTYREGLHRLTGSYS